MKVFISWSGVRSKFIANELRLWLPRVIQAIKPWMSDIDIPAGARWLTDVTQQLDDANFGIICVTPENVEKPWLMFEAGALSKSMKTSQVCPLVHEMELGKLSGPIAQFQSNFLNIHGIFNVLMAANASLEHRLSDEHLREQFDLMWPKLMEKLDHIPSKPEVPLSSPVVEQRLTQSLPEQIELLTVAIKALHGREEFMRRSPELRGEVTSLAVEHVPASYGGIQYLPVSTLEGAILTLETSWPGKSRGKKTVHFTLQHLDTIECDLKLWKELGLTLPIVAIDLSYHPDVDSLLDRLFVTADIYPLELEIGFSETDVVTDLEGSVQRLQTLTDKGLLTCIRDFGEGYSSLSFLRRLAIQRIWISPAFTSDVAHAADDQAIIRAIGSLAESLKLQVVACGVNELEQSVSLGELGIRTIAGDMAGSPMTSEEVFDLLSK